MQARLRFQIAWFAPVLVAAIAALAPASALADQPVREGLPAGPFTLDASICGFAVDVTAPRNTEFIKTFSDGRQLINGALVATLTNEQNGKSTTVNISGPGSVVPHADGTSTFTLSGRSLIYLLPGQVGAGSQARLIWTSGPVVFQVDRNGNFTSYDIASAHVVDLCAVLAG